MNAAPPWALVACGVAVLLTLSLPTPRGRRLGGAGLLLAGLGLVADAVAGGGDSIFRGVNLALTAVGALLIALAALRPWPASVQDARGAARAPTIAGDPLLVAGLLLAAVAPHLLLFGLGMAAALVAGFRHAIRGRNRAGVAVLAVAALLLLAALAITATIVGPMGGRVAPLREGPFSPPAERLLTLLAGAFSFAVAGLSPIGRPRWGRALAPAAALLLARIAVPAWPGGLAEWRPLADLLLVAALGIAGIRADWNRLLAAAGLIGIWSGEAPGVAAGLGLVGCAWLAEGIGSGLARRGLTLAPRWAGMTAVVPVLLGFPVFAAALRQEVLISTVGALLLATGLAVGARRPGGPTL